MIVPLAFLIDLWLGDPPNAWHPVAWMGHIIAWGKRRAPVTPQERLRYGRGLIVLGSLGTGMIAWAVDRALPNNRADALVRAVLLKLALSWHGLRGAATEIETALKEKELAEARRLVSWHLVSRDVGQLDAGQVASAAIESVAENLSDSLVAPLLYYVAGGLPAAWVYRFVNTADAMIGYRDPEHAELGQGAARLDDVLNTIPSRLTALCIAAAARVVGEDGPGAWNTALGDHAQTDSPNAGWPMGAMAGALGISLEKVDHYQLGDGPAPQPGDIGRALRVAGVATAAALVGATLLRWLLARSETR